MLEASEPVRVSYLLDRFPALSETFILNEIIELRKQGIDVTVFSLSLPHETVVHKEAEELSNFTHYLTSFRNKSSLGKFYSYLSLHLHFLASAPLKYLRALRFAYRLGKFRYVFSRFRVAAYIALLLKQSKAAHIHSHFSYTASEYAMLASLLSGIPYSFTLHAYDIFQEFRLIKEKIELAKFVVVISEYNRRYLKKKCPTIDEDKVHVIHCGVDLEKLAAFRPNQNNSNQPFTILSIGRLIEKKGQKFLLEACSILAKRGISGLICKIIGDGPLRSELEECAINLGLSDYVKLVGSIPNDEVMLHLGGSGLFVLPCVVAKDGDMDGIPVSLMEAMALGKPVVSTHVSGIPELVKDGAGILVPPGDSLKLADAIEKIHSMDLQRRNDIGKKGKEIIADEFNIKKEVEKLKALFINYSEDVTQSQLGQT